MTIQTLDIISLAKYSGLTRMISETEENVRNLRYTINQRYHHPAYLMSCRDNLEHCEQLLVSLKRASEIAEELKLFPIDTEFKFSGEVFTVSSHYISESGELWSGLKNDKGQVMTGTVKSWLHEILMGKLKPLRV
ncbi:TPA: hypothetical protein I7682_17840 [Vibrio vulnificus]|nr:hypothetical protein [Vibrio vulnificus]